MTVRWAFRPFVGAGVVVLALLGGCGGHALAPQAPSPLAAGSPALPGGSLGHGIFAVIMRPQQPVVFPDKAISWLAPSEVLKLLPPAHEASCDGSGWLKSGGSYDDALPQAHISREGVDSQLGRYSPQWVPGDPISDLAYGVYRWNLRGFSGNPTMKLTWDSAERPSDYSKLYIGLADVTRDTWHWYAGPADGVLTVPSFSPYRDAAGRMLMVVVMLGDQQVVLQSLEAGALETRGTGAELSGPGSEPGYPLLAGSGSLPQSVDLAADCAPINDQGNWGSCTAFAVGDGAYNHELNRIYHPFGWDLANPAYRVSPKYLYIVSGELEGVPPGGDYGRWTDQVIEGLVDHGVATELNAPYDLIYDNNWSQAALDDAQVLKINSWQRVDCSTADGIANVKTILALQRKPLAFQMYLDASFFAYQAGQVWYPQSDIPVGGHAMCIVGYDDAKGAFKVRNSWGEYWGDNGYVWIAYDAFLAYSTGALAYTLTDEYAPAVATHFGLPSGGWEPVTGVSASDGTLDQAIQVSWNQHARATSYKVYRDRQSDLVQTVLDGATTSWVDSSITDGYGHVYWVQPSDGAGNGPLSTPEVGYASHAPDVLSVTPTTGEEGTTVTFFAAGYGSGQPLYAWNFGGGATPNTTPDPHPLEILGSPGTYNASVVVTSSLGSDTFNFTLTVTGVKPRIQYIEHRSGFVGDVVTLEPSTTGAIDAYSWNFGGGATPNTSTAQQPTVTLGAAGLYESSLTVTNTWGSDIFNFYLAVLDPNETDWMVPGHDRRGSGQSPVAGPQSNNVKWKYFAGLPAGVPNSNQISNVLALSDGDIIVSMRCGFGGASLKRLNPDGTAQWSKLVGAGEAYEQPTIGESSGNLYVTRTGVLLALDPNDGSEKWHSAPPSTFAASPLAEGGNAEIYALDTGRYLFALDTGNGSLVLQPVEMSDRWNTISAAVMAPNGMIFIGSKFGYDYMLVAFDTNTDTSAGSLMVPSEVVGLALSPDGTTLYASGGAGEVRAYDTQSCRQLWLQTATCGSYSSNLNPPRVMADGTVLLANQDGLLCALDPETGEVLWSYDLALQGDCNSPPAIGRDGTAYFGGSDRKFHAVRDGDLIWESPEASTRYFNGDPSIGPDGTLYCGDDYGWLWAFGPGSGEERIPALVETVSPLERYSGDVVTFEAVVWGSTPLSYSWNFGGGATPNTSTAVSPTVTLGAPGTYNCTLQLSNVFGNCTYNFTLTVDQDIGPHWEHYTLHDFGYAITLDASGAMIGGKPAVAVDDEEVALYYLRSLVSAPTRAADWALETIDATTPAAFQYSRLEEIGGGPAVAYCHGGKVWYGRRVGSTWQVHGAISSGVETGSDLALVNGHPAVVCGVRDGSQLRLAYARATTTQPSSSTDWVQMFVGDTSDTGYTVELADVGGKPNITFGHRDSGTMRQAFARATVVDPSVPADWTWHYIDTVMAYQDKADILVSAGKPLIAVGTTQGTRELRLYRPTSATPNGPLDWVMHDIDSGSLIVMGNFLKIAGLPVVAYTGGAGWPYMSLARSDTDDPQAPADWTIESISKDANLLWAFAVDGSPVLLAQNGTSSVLEYWYFVQ